MLQTIADPAGRITTLAHSSADLTSVTLPDGSAWTYGYNGDGVIDQLTDPRSKSLTVTYDSNHDGRVASTVRSDGGTESITYYQEEGLVPYGQGTSTSPAALTMMAASETTYVDPLGRTFIDYPDWQGYGRLNQTLDPYGDVTTDERDDSGQDYVSIDSQNRITQKYYDSHGNVTEIVYPDGSTESDTYNGFDEVTSDTDPNGHITTYTYDYHGNLTGIQDRAQPPDDPVLHGHRPGPVADRCERSHHDLPIRQPGPAHDPDQPGRDEREVRL